MRFWVIRHRATGKLMPQMKRGRGYSHWNPGNPSAHVVHSVTDVPRLLTSEKQARKVVKLWSIYPNATTKHFESPATGEWDEDFRTKPDGRSADDLEIVAVQLTIIP